MTHVQALASKSGAKKGINEAHAIQTAIEAENRKKAHEVKRT
jgi:hypothetical protein